MGDDGRSRSPAPAGKKAALGIGLYLTFACMGFSTGWSSVDSIFQQVNKYVMVYEDLSFASNLVYITSAAAATVLLLTFLGLYCAPNGVELRTVAFFETTITAVLAASCTVQLSLALYWDHARWVVETCAFVGAMMGNIQAFIIYPFFNAFYRTELLGAMNVGETSTSLFCGVLALAQSPSVGVENFSVTTYFGIVFAGAFIASCAWASLACQTGHRRNDVDNGEADLPADEEQGGSVGEGGGSGAGRGGGEGGGYGATDADTTGDGDDASEGRTKQKRASFEEVLGAGGAVSRGTHGIALTEEAARDAFATTPTGERVRRKASFFDLENMAGYVDHTCGRVVMLVENFVTVVGREGSHLKHFATLAIINTLMTWSMVGSLIPFSAAAAAGTCNSADEDARMFIRLCTSVSSICRVLGPLCVRADGKWWGHPTFVKFVGVCGILINIAFCLPAFVGPVASAPGSFWATDEGRAVLLCGYVLSTPIEPFMQLHLLLQTQRENSGSSKRIIDAGFSFAAIVVLLSYGVAGMLASYTKTGTLVCRDSVFSHY